MGNKEQSGLEQNAEKQTKMIKAKGPDKHGPHLDAEDEAAVVLLIATNVRHKGLCARLHHLCSVHGRHK